MRRENSSPIGLTAIGIAALFLAGFFLLEVFGAQSYRDTVRVQNENMQSRALLQSLSTAVHACDARDAVSVTEDAVYGQVLNLEDGDSGYALRFYLADGALVQESSPLEAPLMPESAQPLGETGSFEAARDGSLLRLHTDAGTVLLHLRSGEETP